MSRGRLAGARTLAALAAAAVVGSGCARLLVPRRAAVGADAPTLVAALAARTAALRGARISMTVRVRGRGAASILASPAYLAIDGPESVRLQVLSPFGVTLLDLAVRDGRYQLALPLRNEHRAGALELASVADPAVAPEDRMVLALALLFRAPPDPARCRTASGDTLVCPAAPGVVVRTTFDAARRPLVERYERADGAPFLEVRFAEYGAGVLPGRIEVRDPGGEAELIARVLRVRPAATTD